MSRENISPDHINYWLDRVALSGEDLAKQKRDVLEQVGARATALDLIESRRPGTREILEQSYLTLNSGAVQLWSLPVFGGLTETDLVRDIQKVVRCEVTPNATIQVGEVDVSVAGPVVQTLRLNDRGELDVLVTVVKHMNRTVMRQSYSYPIIAEVALRVHLNRKDRLVEAYAGDANARTALLGFLRSAFGLHSVSAARKSEAVRPVGFSVRRVDQMATDQGFRLLSVLCPPKSGAKYLDGRLATRVNRLRVPLPDEERTRELTSEHNSFRSYQFTFRHPDGFEEISEVDFDFRNASHPAIGFPIRTSRPAMRSAITPLV